MDVPGVRKSDLLAIVAAPGPAWVGIIREAWEAGAAVFPVDHRLPPRERDALLARAHPTAAWDGEAVTRFPDRAEAAPETALVVATSGTAGTPKLAELTHAAVRAAIEGSAARLGCAREDPWLCCLPPAHMGGLLVLLRSVVSDALVEVHPSFDPARVARASAAFTSLVPTMLSRLLDRGAGAGIETPLARFRAVLVGGAALSPNLGARARDAGVNVVETYGLTETCGGVVYDGRPFDGTEVRVGTGEDDTAGEIFLRGPTLFSGYRADPAATRAARTEDGWLRTRDAGAIEDGRLHVLGRLDDVVVTGGEKVWPEEVETALREHPRVADAGIAGTPDPEWGARVVAFVVPAPGADPPGLDELRAFVKERLAAYKAPRQLVLLPRLPRTESGKLRRMALREVDAI